MGPHPDVPCMAKIQAFSGLDCRPKSADDFAFICFFANVAARFLLA